MRSAVAACIHNTMLLLPSVVYLYDISYSPQQLSCQYRRWWHFEVTFSIWQSLNTKTCLKTSAQYQIEFSFYFLFFGNLFGNYQNDACKKTFIEKDQRVMAQNWTWRCGKFSWRSTFRRTHGVSKLFFKLISLYQSLNKKKIPFHTQKSLRENERWIVYDWYRANE